MKDTTLDRRAAKSPKANCSKPIESQPQTPEEFLDDRVLDRIGFLVHQLTRRYGLQKSCADDARQELITGLLEASARFDSAKASWHTFASNALDICCKRYCRNGAHDCEYPAGDPFSDDDSDDEGAAHILNSRTFLEDKHTAIDVADVIAQMPPSLREVCEFLKLHSISDTARLLGIHRNVLYRKIKSIRGYFVRASKKK